MPTDCPSDSLLEDPRSSKILKSRSCRCDRSDWSYFTLSSSRLIHGALIRSLGSKSSQFRSLFPLPQTLFPCFQEVHPGIMAIGQHSIIATYARSSFLTPDTVRLAAHLSCSVVAPAAIVTCFPRCSLLQRQPQRLDYSLCTIAR